MIAVEQMPQLALLVPVYNPPLGWQDTLLARFQEFRDAIAAPVQLVVIDDGSVRDLKTEASLIENSLGQSFTLIQHGINKGKGAALKTGAGTVEASWYMFTDVDFPYSLESMVNVWQHLSSQSGIVTGYREQTYYADVSPFRTVVSRTLRALNRLILRLPVNDTQCGLKGFDRQTRDVLLTCKTDRFLIDLELLLAVTAKKISIHSVFVQLRSEISFTQFRSSVLLREVFSFFRLLWKYRILNS